MDKALLLLVVLLVLSRRQSPGPAPGPGPIPPLPGPVPPIPNRATAQQAFNTGASDLGWHSRVHANIASALASLPEWANRTDMGEAVVSMVAHWSLATGDGAQEWNFNGAALPVAWSGGTAFFSVDPGMHWTSQSAGNRLASYQHDPATDAQSAAADYVLAVRRICPSGWAALLKSPTTADWFVALTHCGYGGPSSVADYQAKRKLLAPGPPVMASTPATSTPASHLIPMTPAGAPVAVSVMAPAPPPPPLLPAGQTPETTYVWASQQFTAAQAAAQSAEQALANAMLQLTSDSGKAANGDADAADRLSGDAQAVQSAGAAFAEAERTLQGWQNLLGVAMQQMVPAVVGGERPGAWGDT